MKLAVSSMAFPAHTLDGRLPQLAEMGFAGLELPPASTWSGGLHGLGSLQVKRFRRTVEQAGLAIVGFHSLLQGQEEMGLFAGTETLRRTADFVVRASGICRDLGGRTLVLGGSRFRGKLDEKAAWNSVLGFLDAVLPRIEEHGTVLCIDPLGPDVADFCHRATDCRLLVNYVDHPSLGIQLSSAALVENKDQGHAPFAAVRGRLDIFHATEPGWASLSSTGLVDHADFRRHLAAISYGDWVSLHQRPNRCPCYSLAECARALRTYYLRPDNLSLGRLRQEAAPSQPSPGAIATGSHLPRSIAMKLIAEPPSAHEAAAPEDCEAERYAVVAEIIEELRPPIQKDGGDMELVEIVGDRIFVRLSGACTTCSHAGQTLGGVRRRVMDRLGAPLMVLPAA